MLGFELHTNPTFIYLDTYSIQIFYLIGTYLKITTVFAKLKSIG